jgi:O-antigen ligase
LSLSYLKSDFKIYKSIYFAFFFILILISIYFDLTGNYKNLVFCISIPLVLLLSFYFDKYFMLFFVISLFIGHTFPLRIQIVNIVSFAIIFYFFLNQNTDTFLQYNLPREVKVSGLLFLFAVLLSSFNTPHFSFLSVYFGFGFLVYMSLSYVTFRFSNSSKRIFNLLNAFFYTTFIAGIIVIIFILITGYIRFFAISGMAYYDFSPVALVISIFGYFILGKSNNLIKIATVIIFITLITSLSRNSWIGFTLSFLYGIFITARFKKGLLNFFKNKIAIILGLFFAILLLFIFTGLGNVLLGRINEVNSGLFTVTDEGALINNSLETRILIWIVALNAFIQNPLTGVGYFMFWNVSEQYNVLPQILYDNIVKGLDAHTTLMNILCETGIIGLSCFILYIITMLRFSYKAIILSKDANEQRISIILHIIVFFISVHSIYAGAFTLGQNAFQMHFFFGLAIANYVNLYYSKRKILT